MVVEEENWKDCLAYAAQTDIGMRRAINQDSYVVVLASNEQHWQSHGHLLMVADGMGAHAAGEYASSLAVAGVPRFYQKFQEKTPREAIEKAFHATNDEIHTQGRNNPDYFGMGTTGSLLLLVPDGALIAHVGDSRVYRQRGRLLEQLTFDHSLVWEMQATGRLSKHHESSLNIPKNVITRSLGSHRSVEVDVEGPLPIQQGDKFLLCSDGLTGKITDQELAEIVAHFPPRDAVPLLVNLANLRGGNDNITVMIACVTGQLLASPSSTDLPSEKSQSQQNLLSLAWTIIAILSLSGAGYLWHLEKKNAFLTATLGGLIALILAIWNWLRKTASPQQAGIKEAPQTRHGPYTKTPCPSEPKLLEDLLQTVDFYRDEARRFKWPVDWEVLEQCCREASSAQENHRTAEATKKCAAAIDCLAQSLRESKR